MDHSAHSHSSSVEGGEGVPENPYFPRLYWAVIGAAIALATVVNLLNKALCWQRLSAARADRPSPAKPQSAFFRIYATITAITRELSHASLPALRFRRRSFGQVTLGPVILVLSNLAILLICSFHKLNPKDQWQWEDIGYRTGWVAMGQLPLIFLLAGKNNIIGFLTGSSHERLNWLHRWVARCLFVIATIHMGYWLRSWNRYAYIGRKLKTEQTPRTGLGAWAVLAWIVFSSMSPIRGWCYEFFVVQHLISFAAFIAMVYVHTPESAHVWIWVPVGLFVFDRLVRYVYFLYNNLLIFHRGSKRGDPQNLFWACKAELTPLPHNITRLTIHSPPLRWHPGQHVFLSCHSILPLQSHPFTITSLPEDDKMEFLVRAENGGTRHFFTHAEKLHVLPTSETQARTRGVKTITVDGPYGRIRPLQQFDSVVFFAGGIGVTFTLPLLRDLVRTWRLRGRSDGAEAPRTKQAVGVVTRRVRFVWIVKSRDQVSWFARLLGEAIADVDGLREEKHDIQLEMSIYVTCDDSLTSDEKAGFTPDPPCEPQRTEPPVSPEKSSDLEPQAVATKDEATIQELPVQKAPRDGSQTCGSSERDCCCRVTIEDEDEAHSLPRTCTCGASSSFPLQQPPSPIPSSSSTSSATTTSSSRPQSKNDKPSVLPLLAGRPHPRTLIRKTLEQARGESAVVVCGPPALMADVRTAVVALSDERAVHKGTGALGVWLHCEGYGY